ncbi:MAG: sigma-54-dependent transcriptional regulator [Leptospirales bacterium]
MRGPLLLIVDDHANTRAYLRTLLEHEGYLILEASTGEKALDILNSGEGDLVRVVLLDLKLPNISGIDLIRPIRESRPTLPVIIMTAHASVPTAVSAIQQGAFHYLEKPLSEEALLETLKNALLMDKLPSRENTRKEGQPEWPGIGPFMDRLMERIRKASKHAFPVLVTGESGTGKELIARTIHHLSTASGEPFVAVNTGAIPKDLVSSELFGSERGSFTGATERKAGWFEAAGKGTLFLDEIGTMDLSTQIALLRVIENRMYSRVGGTAAIPFTARIICATNDDLPHLIREGRFREDLYYRLNVHTIFLPPLRERREDILPLANHFLLQTIAPNTDITIQFDQKAIHALEHYPWPGNIRELKNTMISVAIERGSEFPSSGHCVIPAEWLPETITALEEEFPGATLPPRTLRDGEREQIRKVLLETGGNKALASRILGISRKALYAKLKDYGFVSDSRE